MFNSERRYSAVLLDFDGTYADTAPDMIGALNTLRARADRPPVDYDSARPYISHGSKALVNLGFGDCSDSEKQSLVRDFLDAYASNVASNTRAFAGIEDWIGVLEKHSIKWGIVTNKPEYLTTAVLAQMPLPHTPHCVVAGDSLVKRKPHPMPALHAAALIKVPANECLFVGDALSDITAGRTAGMYTIAAAYGYILPTDNPYSWNAHKVADSVEELCNHANSVLGVA